MSLLKQQKQQRIQNIKSPKWGIYDTKKSLVNKRCYICKYPLTCGYNIKHDDNHDNIRYLGTECIKEHNQYFQKFVENDEKKERIRKDIINSLKYEPKNKRFGRCLVVEGAIFRKYKGSNAMFRLETHTEAQFKLDTVINYISPYWGNKKNMWKNDYNNDYYLIIASDINFKQGGIYKLYISLLPNNCQFILQHHRLGKNKYLFENDSD